MSQPTEQDQADIAREYLRYSFLADYEDWLKRRRGFHINWDPRLHPRDERGRFIGIGAGVFPGAPTGHLNPIGGRHAPEGRFGLLGGPQIVEQRGGDAMDRPNGIGVRQDLARLRTKDDVEQYLRTKIKGIVGKPVGVDLGRKMHLQTMKEITEGILRSAESWPELNLDKIGHGSRLPGAAPDAWAITAMNPHDGKVSIMFNDRQFGNRERFLNKLARTVDNGSARPGQDNAAYVAMHEMGQVVAWKAARGDPDRLKRLATGMRNDAIDNARLNGVNILDEKAVRKHIAAALGDYANHSPHEMMAEAFADVEMNGQRAHPLSIQLMDRLSRSYRRALNAPDERRPRRVASVDMGQVPVRVPGSAPGDVRVAANEDWKKYHDNLTGIEDIAQMVEKEAIVHERGLGGGVMGDTRLRTYESGGKTVWKKATDMWGIKAKQQADAEQLASMMGNAIGADAARVYRNSDNIVHMEALDGLNVGQSEGGNVRTALKTDAANRINVLDVLMNNGDRHHGNMMIVGTGEHARPFAIDHGLAWNELGDHIGRPRLPTLAGIGIESSRLSVAELQKMKPKLEALRPDFQRLGREKWLDYSLKRLTKVIALERQFQ